MVIYFIKKLKKMVKKIVINLLNTNKKVNLINMTHYKYAIVDICEHMENSDLHTIIKIINK